MVDDRLQQRLTEVTSHFHDVAAKLSGEKLASEVVSDATVDRAKQSSVRITSSNSAGPRGTGSGFIVGAGNEIITNLHVVGNARSIDVATPSGEHFTARITKVDELSDLALLKVDGMNADSSRAVKFGSTADLKPYSQLFAVGHPNGVEQAQVSMGRFTSLGTYEGFIGKEEANQWRQALPVFYGSETSPGKYAAKPGSADYRAYVDDAEKYLAAGRVGAQLIIDHGNSGGLVQNAQGETIGVATNISPQKSGEAFLVPAENVVNLINNPNNRFAFNYEKETKFDRNPALTVASDAAILGLGYKFRSLAAPIIGAAYSVNLYNDLKLATSSDIYGDRSEYITDAAIDGAAVAGGVLSLIPKTKLLGYGLVGARTLYDVGSDFFKGEPVLNHIKRTDSTQPERSGEPLYWSLVDRVNANSGQVAPRSTRSIQGMNQGLKIGRH